MASCPSMHSLQHHVLLLQVSKLCSCLPYSTSTHPLALFAFHCLHIAHSKLSISPCSLSAFGPSIWNSLTRSLHVKPSLIIIPVSESVPRTCLFQQFSSTFSLSVYLLQFSPSCYVLGFLSALVCSSHTPVSVRVQLFIHSCIKV